MKTQNSFFVVALLLAVCVLATPAAGKNTQNGVGDPGIAPPPGSFSGTDWFDRFDTYANGSLIIGQGGWEGWDNSAAFNAAVTDAFSFSMPHSLESAGPTDVVQLFTGYTSGQWVMGGWLYVPSGMVGQTYFISLNTYNHGGPYNWSAQTFFDGGAGQVVSDAAGGGLAALLFDQWVEFRIEIDLDADTQTGYYNGAPFYSGSWTNGLSGGGAVNIAAIDIFANNATSVYWDDVFLCPPPGGDCVIPVELMSVSVD